MEENRGNLAFRPLTEPDLEYMLKWLTDERVLEFYEGRDFQCDMESLREKYLERESAPGFMIELNGEPIGYSQMYPVRGELFAEYDYPETDENVYAMDQFIGVPELWGKGIGTQYLRMALGYLKNEKAAEVVLLDPHENNTRAVRAYEKAGFRIQKKLPAHEAFEGTMADCLLMEYRFDTH